jgi:hypothetical protein
LLEVFYKFKSKIPYLLFALVLYCISKYKMKYSALVKRRKSKHSPSPKILKNIEYYQCTPLLKKQIQIITLLLICFLVIVPFPPSMHHPAAAAAAAAADDDDDG